tara:strand:+ start:793 stop:1431 length:639 start_codon:yes stop_codon:yes gene_type:complete
MYQYLKVILDFLLSVFILLVLLPVLLGVGFSVLLTMGRPVLFKQERIGKNNKPFLMYKFRTMREPIKGQNRLLSDADRITRLGDFLRRSSLDELPEIINIIKGDMSLVGPRPLLDFHLELFDKYQQKRHSIKPGMTGLAQIMGRQSLSFKERINLDLEYVNKMSFLLDIKILMKTIFVVLGTSGVKNGQKFEEVDDVGLKELIEKKYKQANE